MTGSNLCRLCSILCNDNIRLRDTNGNPNEVYDVTTRYFHPTFLEVESGAANVLPVLCSNCWHNISGFNNFKRNVLIVQENFLKGIEKGLGIGEPLVFEQSHQDQNSSTQFIVTEYEMKFPNDITSLTNDLKKEIAEMRSSHSLGTDQMAISSHPVKVEKTYNVALLPPTYLESADYPYGDPIDSPRSSVHSTYEPTKYTRNIRKKPKFRKTKKTISSSLTELDAIIAQWKPILECRSCPETFTCFTLLQDHAWKQHPEVEFYVICCDREFRMRCRLAQHVRLHLNPKTYECKECNRIMASKHNLQEHMDRVHVKTVTPRRNMRHKCHFCPKSYDNPIMLREHVYSHTDQDISQCPYCPRTFRQYNGVYQHIRRVHPGKYLLSQKKNKNRFSV